MKTDPGVVGPSGERGAIGAKGDVGSVGVPGSPGARGLPGRPGNPAPVNRGGWEKLELLLDLFLGLTYNCYKYCMQFLRLPINDQLHVCKEFDLCQTHFMNYQICLPLPIEIKSSSKGISYSYK